MIVIIFLFLFSNLLQIQGQFDGNGGNPNIFGGLSNLGRQFGFDMPSPENGPRGGPRLGRGPGPRPEMNFGGLINQFIAPPQHSNIPPHVFRRIIRFCRRHPGHPRCQGHPEWNQPSGNLPPNPLEFMGDRNLNLNDMFPDLINFKLPPIPRLNLPDLLRNVPDVLKNVIPAPILGQITEFAKNAIMVSLMN